MIAPSTKFSSFTDAVRSLAASPDHYYIKRPHIVHRISHDGRTFYAKFERVDTPLGDTEIAGHLARQTTLAIPLIHHGEGSHIAFLYEGEAPGRFVHLFRHLMASEAIDDFMIYPGKRDAVRLAILTLPQQKIAKLHPMAKRLSERLETQIPKSWKLLPDPSLPESYNIITLPYIN